MMILTLLPLQTSVASAEVEAEFDASKMPISSAYLQILPEYDAPRTFPEGESPVLVFYRGTMKNETGKDYDGVVPIPVHVDVSNFQIIAVGEYTSAESGDSGFDIQDTKYSVDAAAGVINLQPSTPIGADKEFHFGISYVMSPMEVTDKKSFTLDFTSNMDIAELDVEIFLPPGAQDFTVTPTPDSEERNENGEQNYKFKLTDVSAGESMPFAVSYVKKDNVLTTELLGIKSDAPPPPPDSNGNVDSGGYVVAAIIIGISLVIFGALVFFGLQGRQQNGNRGKKGNTNRKSTPKKQSSVKSEGINEGQKKKLRKQFIEGKISEEAYHREMKKASGNDGRGTIDTKEKHKKKLRKQLIVGEINEEAYQREIDKLR